MKTSQRGGFVLGLIVGLLVGLAVALGVALYITKAPVPFVNKVPQRTAEQDTAETERNRNWDPNAPLAGKPAAPKPPGQAPATATAPAPATLPAVPPGTPDAASAARPGRDPAAILAGTVPAAGAYVFFVQAGAYTRSEEAEQQRAKVALLGLSAGISEREQAGRTVHRVRIGPYETREEADAVQARLTQANIESRMVRAERE